MHKLFEQVLERKDLSKAGDLFSLEDSVIVDELSAVIKALQEISSKPEFLTCHNDQSLVEILVTRVISAVRETDTVGQHAWALVSLLESCLAHSLRPSSKGDPPHAKMASDIMSCVLLNYNKKAVMQLAIPVAVKFLHKGNKELSRNMSSYMSLAAIENADLLAAHLQPILDSVISGNYSLSRVLPAIYAVDRKLIQQHVMTLVSILPNCADTESLALLSLFSLIAKDNPVLLEPSIPQLCEGLTQATLAPATIQVLQYIAFARPKCLVDNLAAVRTTASTFPKSTVSAVQLLSVIGRSSLEKSRETLDFILEVVGGVEVEKQNLVLKEVVNITQKYPSLLTSTVVSKISGLEDGASSQSKNIIAELRSVHDLARVDRPQEKKPEDSGRKSKAGVTIVRVGGSRADVNSGVARGTEAFGGSSSARVELTSVVRHNRETASFSPAPATSGGDPSGEEKRGETSSGSSRGQERKQSSEKLLLEKQLLEQHQFDRSLPSPCPVPVPWSPTKRDCSRSTGRLATHRSMTRLNMQSSASRLETRLGLHKSLTRLDTRYPSSQAVTPTTSSSVGRSVTNISTSSRAPAPLSTYSSRPPVTVTTSSVSASPTKSMSSGSMSGLPSGDRDLAGNPILTVNIHQITTQLQEQLSRPGPLDPRDYTRDSSLPPITPSLSSSTAPLSLPSSSSRRLPPYSSGPLTPQPPSLQMPPPAPMALTSSSSQPLDPSSQDRLPGPAKTAAGWDAPRSTFSNTLPSLRRRQHHITCVSTSDGGDISEGRPHTEGGRYKHRISVFEPFPMRDTVQHFCEKHLDKIKAYMESVGVKLPLPVKFTIEERKGKKHAKLHFACQGRGEHCLYKTTFYPMKSRHARTWIHLMFMALQSRSQSALSTRDPGVSSLKNCWEILKCEEKSFSTLVTGAFPPARDQDSVIHELRAERFFDVFEYNAPKNQWGCFLCNHPERASTFIAQEEPVIEGQLKEKKGGKWKIFKKWKSRYFTLSGARLAYKDEAKQEGVLTVDVGSIRSINIKGGRNIPKAFEIFTADKTFILKAKDSSKAQEWVQCLTVAMAHSQAKDSTLRRLAYGGSLGRLNQGSQHARSANYHSSLNSNLALRTAV